MAADLTVNPAVTDVACSGGNSGGITVNTTGGLAPLRYALDNGAYTASRVFASLGAGSYAVKVRDASGCVATRNVTIGSSTAMQVSVSAKTDESCAANGNGSVSLQASGGAGNYTYSKDGSSFVAGPVFSNLAAGPYLFSARDDNGCLAAVRDTIRTTSKIVAGIASQQHVSCFGGNNGSFTLSTTGSQPSGAVSFSKDNGASFQASNVFGGLSAGSYPVVVKDAVCSTTLNVVITQPGELTITAALQKAVSCNGLSDGIIDGTAASGTGPYQYSINGSSYVTTGVFGGLSNGNYKLWVKDANGCVKESNVVAVTQPANVSVSVAGKTDLTCFGANNGSLALAGQGGTPPYQFAKDGLNFQAAPSFAGLPAGNLTITLRDANGCKATVAGEILQPGDLTVAATNSGTVSCFGGANGQLTATASGGTGLVTYSINATDFLTSPIFTGLTAGSYQVTARDANGCQKVSAAVIVAQAAQIMPSFTKSDVKCFSGSDGLATITATGGTGSYTYSKDAGGFQSSGSFPNLPSGSFVFSVKDANSCVRTVDVTITQPSDLVVSNAIVQQVLCHNGTSGIIQAGSSGGTAPYRYSLNGTSYQASPSFSSLPVGTYKVWVKDANGCVKETNTVTPTQPADLAVSVTAQTAAQCNSGSDGSVQLAATGGVSPYGFSKDSVSYQAASLFSGLAARSFRFIVKDGNGCTKGVSAVVAQPAQAYQVTLASQTSLTCNNQNIGRIEVANSGGTAPYQLSLDNTNFQSSRVFGNLSAATYTVYGKDANSCRFTLPGITLSQPTGIVVSLLNKKDVDCEYYTKGEALVAAAGSNGNFTYTLGGSDFKFNPVGAVTNATGFFDNLKAGDYTVTARDQSGCTLDFPVAIIPKSSNIRYDVTKSLPSNCTSGDGSIGIINTSGGNPPYQYSISSQNSFSSNPTFGGLLNGTYIVTVADELCSYKQEVNLTLPNSIRTAYTIDPVSCATLVANLNVTGISGGNGNYQLSLNGGPFSGNRTFVNLHPKVYSLVVQDSPLSCKTATAIEIKEQNRADLQIVSRQNVLCHGGNSGLITIKGDNNVGPFTYALNSGAFGNEGTFAGLSIGTYRLYAKNRLGCIDSLRTTLVQPTALTSSFTKKDNDCNGDKTGSLEIGGAGGTPAYSFSIDGAGFSESGKFEALTANTYTAYVRDANGCVSTQSVPVMQPALLTVAPAYQDTIRCFGESSGIVRVAAGGGSPAYQYSMNGSDFIADPNFANLALGTYKFYVKDSKGCLKESSLALTQPERLELALESKRDPLCHEGKDGTIRVASKGGNGGNTYTLDNGVNQPQALFSGLTQSVYSIRVTDRRGCGASMETVALKWPAKIESKYATVMPVCNGESNGTITVDVRGGTPGYQAILDGQARNPVDNRFTFNNIKSATYAIDIKDQNGCIDKLSVLLEEPTPLLGTINASNNKCFGDQTGAIRVSGSGATPGYAYALDEQAYSGSGSFTGLVANTYKIQIKDAAGCVLIRQVLVEQPTKVSLSAVNSDTVRCFGEKNGSVRLLATGGTPGYVYSQDGSQYYSDDMFKNLAAGPYQFRVKDAQACEHTASLSLTEPSRLDLAMTSKTDPLCAGDQNGTIALSATGGNSLYAYWKDNATQQQTGLFKGLTQAEYAFKVVDRKGCQAGLTPVKLVWPKSLQSRVSWTAPVCAGESNASIAIALSGGTSPYSVVAPSIASRPTVGSDSWNYSGLAPGHYMLNARDGNGCLSFSVVNIAAAEKINTAIFPAAEPVCKGQELILDANNPGLSVQWFYKGVEISPALNSQQLTAAEAGAYKVLVTNKTGCSSESQFVLENNDKALKADFLMTVQAFVGDTITVLDISRPAPDQIAWELPDQAQTIIDQTTKLSFSVISKGDYTIKMLAKKGDCSNVKIRTIRIFDKEDIAETDSLLHYREINIIQEMIVYPNPNFGKFTVTVKLARVTDVVLTMAESRTNTPVLRQEKKGAKEYVFEINQQNFQQQVYIITVQAGRSILFKRALLMN